MKAITDWLRSVGGTGQAASTDSAPDGAEPGGTSLFHCPTCDVVYVATEKRTCSTCETAVEQVPDTFDEA